MGQEENWFEKTWGSILGRHSIKLDHGQMPKGVEPITWKDGSTTYNFQGKEYSNVEDIPVPRAEWIDKTTSALGESISKIPNIDKIGSVVAPIARTAEQLEHPFESQWAEMVGDSFQQYGIDRRIGVGVGYATFPGFGEVKAVKKAVKGSMELAPALARVDSGGVLSKADDLDLEKLSAQPLQVGHKMERSTKTDSLEGLINSNVSNKQVVDFLKKGPSSALDNKYKYISEDKLAAQPELLGKLFTRNKNIKSLQEKYLKKLAISQADPSSARKGAATSNAQRAWYDEVAKNLFSDEMLIYGKDKPRQLVAQATKWVTRDEWHHIFGNKEAGEFMMSMVAQDPVIAVNLMKHMQELNLSASGIAQNIAIMKKTGHNNFHKWLKEMGFESVSGKQAPLAIDQYATEISKVATKGYTSKYTKTGKLLKTPKQFPADPSAVNELFGMLTVYAEANKFIRQQLKAGKVTMPDGTVLSLKAGKIEKLPEVMSELKSKKISGFGDVLRSGERMKTHRIGRPRKDELLIR